MTETDEITLDAKSGISIEEQKEILSQINGIAEKNRRSLLQAGPGEAPEIHAKKTGAFFPLAFNIAAVAALCAGAFLLISFNGKTDARVRKGTAVFNLTERALIEEIRRETAEKISAKDLEILQISSRLSEVDAQLALVFSDTQILSPEQIAAQEKLLSMQNSYRAELSALQDEKSQILENSRSREIALRAQLAADSQSSSAAVDSASGELERMANEQETAAALNAQLFGGIALVSGLISAGEYERAANLINTLRDLGKNKPINFPPAQDQDLAAKNAELEQTVAALRLTIDANDSGSFAQARRVVELEEAASTLRAQVSSLETVAAEKDRTISSLNSENTSLQTANDAQSQEIINLRNQIATIRQLLQE